MRGSVPAPTTTSRLFVAGTVVSDWVVDQVILDVGHQGHQPGGESRARLRPRVPGTDAVLTKLNEYHGFLGAGGR